MLEALEVQVSRRKPAGVRDAYAILRGYHAGDPEEANRYLYSMSTAERRARNRGEQREHGRLRKKKRLMGSRISPRRTY